MMREQQPTVESKEYITPCRAVPVTEVEEWGKEELAYDVQKIETLFIISSTQHLMPAKQRQDVRIMDNVLRFLCVRKTGRAVV